MKGKRKEQQTLLEETLIVEDGHCVGNEGCRENEVAQREAHFQFRTKKEDEEEKERKVTHSPFFVRKVKKRKTR